MAEKSVLTSDAAEPFVPKPPERLEDTGLTPSEIEQLILKNLYYRGEVMGRDLATCLGLRFSLIEPMLEGLKRVRLLEVKRSSSYGNISAVYALTDMGRERAKEFLDKNQFLGPAPVPLETYVASVLRQRPKDGWVTPETLKNAFSRAVVTKEIFTRMGPAVNASKSLLIYGQPGNGKTFLAEQLTHLESEPIYVPYVIEAEGQIVKIFDPFYHQKVEEATSSIFAREAAFDERWARIKRPFITTGGELTLEMLELNYIPSAKVYDAPYQLKANNGVYLVDDFGRQRVTPAELLNRWIYPMDRRSDFLTFQTGTRVQVPFECFLIFSTNLNPHELGDEAFLRRLAYKMFIRNPDLTEFRTIWDGILKEKNIPAEAGIFEYMVETHYSDPTRKMRRCHPRDIVTMVIDFIHFENREMMLTRDLLDQAFECRFVNIAGADD